MFSPDGRERRAPKFEPSSNVVPGWVLPLMRLVKGTARGDLARAWAELPRHLPDGVGVPSEEEAAVTLVELRLG